MATMFEILNWEPPECRKYMNSLPTEVMTSSRLLDWDEKESLKSKFNRMARLVLVTVEDRILKSRKQMMAFLTIRNIFHVTSWISLYLAISIGIIYSTNTDSRVGSGGTMEIWSFHGDKSIFVVHTNYIYHKLVEDKV